MAAERVSTRIIVRTVCIVVIAALTLYIMYRLRRPISFLVIAAFIAVAMTGPVNLLQRFMKRGLAIAGAYLILIAVPVVLGVLLIPTMVGQAEDLAGNVPEYAPTSPTSSTTTRPSRTSTTSTTSPARSRAPPRSCRAGSATPPTSSRTSAWGWSTRSSPRSRSWCSSIFMVAGGPALDRGRS